MSGVNFVKDFTPKEKRQQNEWASGLVIMLSTDGRVVIDNSEKHFGGQIQRKATENDAIYMCSQALSDFNMEKQARILADALRKLSQGQKANSAENNNR